MCFEFERKSKLANKKPNRSPTQWVRFGEEEQRNERTLTFEAKQKSRSKRYEACSDVEQGTGIEPASVAWEATILPMN